ncbi:MAG: hypothetical protein GX443_12300 [Deltaproteobacteria bacterium]|nr:hypothetical protein [Deltaproteobacteria bacterium]
MNLKNYSGPVRKTSTVLTDDPRNPLVKLTLQANVKQLVEVRPGNVVSFRGLAGQMGEQTVDMVTTSEPFHIRRVESTLGGNVSHQLQTIEEGKHYRLKIANQVEHGSYTGFIKCFTDHPRKPEIVVRVIGSLEGEIAVKPPTVLVGKLAAQQPLRMQTVRVINNRGKPFQITKLSYDSNLIRVTQQPLPKDQGYTLEISPVLENIRPGARQQISLGIETDVPSAAPQQVTVLLVNAQDAKTPALVVAPEKGGDGKGSFGEDAPGADEPEKR